MIYVVFGVIFLLVPNSDNKAFLPIKCQVLDHLMLVGELAKLCWKHFYGALLLLDRVPR